MNWMQVARSYLGTAEIPGPRHNKTIQRWLTNLGAWWTDDETPWCGTFMAAVMKEVGLPYPQHYYRARAWAEYGTRLAMPAPGCIAVFVRTGGGHVGFVEGVDKSGRLMVLGGNQGNRVSVAPFDRSRVLAYVWPGKVPPPTYRMPVYGSNQKSSQDER